MESPSIAVYTPSDLLLCKLHSGSGEDTVGKLQGQKEEKKYEAVLCPKMLPIKMAWIKA